MEWPTPVWTAAVPAERAPRGRQGSRGPALGGPVEVGAQVLDSSVGRALGVQVLGVEAGEDDDLPAGPGDGHVEAAFAAGVVEHPEVQRQVSSRVGGEGRREQDRVALLALDVLQVPDEQAVAGVEGLDDSGRGNLA